MNRTTARSVRALTVVLTAGSVLLGGVGVAAAGTPAMVSPTVYSTVSADTVAAPESLVLDGIRHRLANQEQPRPGYVRTAYLPAGQTPGTHERMVVVEALVGSSVPEAARVQVELLQRRRKAIDPLVDVDARTDPRTGEVLIDFTRGGRADDGRSYVEWNAYRFVPINQGVGLYGLSLRAYDDDRLAFARDLRQTRPRELAAVAAARVPDVVLPAT